METYAVTEVEGYCEEIISIVAQEMGAKTTENINQYITTDQAKLFLYENCLGRNEDGKPFINEEVHNTICENIALRIQNVGLAQLASDGYLECAWDDTLNEMIFWLSDSENEST